MLPPPKRTSRGRVALALMLNPDAQRGGAVCASVGAVAHVRELLV